MPDIYLSMKKIVYKYLNHIFQKTEITSEETEHGKVYRGVIGTDTTLFRTQFQERPKGLRSSIHFSWGEFHLIKSMFSLETGETVDIIRDYLGDKIDPKLYDLPFHPYL